MGGLQFPKTYFKPLVRNAQLDTWQCRKITDLIVWTDTSAPGYSTVIYAVTQSIFLTGVSPWALDEHDSLQDTTK
jgi:hypothetical protein